MRILAAIARKDLLLLLRDRAGLFFTFFFPLLYALFFGSIFSSGGDGGARPLPLRLVDLDGSEASAAFLERLAAREEISAVFDSLTSAESAVRRGRASAALIVEPGFGEASERLFWGDPPTLRLLGDPARGAELGLLEGLLFRESFAGLADRFDSPESFLPDIDRWQDSLALPDAPGPEADHLRTWLGDLKTFLTAETAREAVRDSASGGEAATEGAGFGGFEPLRIERQDLRLERIGPRSAFEISFPQGLIWGVIAVASSFGISLVVERKEGTLRRLRAAPLGRRAILGGKALACFTMILALCVGLFAVGRFFGVKPDSPGLLALALLSMAVAFTGLMMLISVLGKTERAAGGIGWAMMMLFAMLGGGMVPLFFMPEWMRTLGHASPVKWAILAIEGAVWRGFTPADMLLPCAVLCGTGIATFLIGVRFFQWNES